MATSNGSKASGTSRRKPTLSVEPKITQAGFDFRLRGSGWDVVPLEIALGKGPVRSQRILIGSPVIGGLRPAPNGEFLIELSPRDLPVGKHRISVRALCESLSLKASTSFEVAPYPARIRLSKETEDEARGRDSKAAGGGGPLMRQLHWFERRFGHLGFIPDGVRKVQLDSVRKLRRRRPEGNEFDDDPAGQPVPGTCNWTPIGPGPVIVSATTAYVGRVISITLDPTNPDIVYAGAANGGVWKSTNRGRTWSPKSDYQMSLAIGALAIDPNNHLRIFAGTGQYGSAVGTYYGNGILFSNNGGDSWAELATATFQRDEISRLIFDPTDPTSQRMLLTSRQGAYQSIDGGVNWTLLRAGAASDLVTIVSGGNLKVIPAFHSVGLVTATRTGMSWSAWTQFTSAVFPTGPFGRIVLGQCCKQPNNVYAAFSSGVGIAGMAKTADGGANWTAVKEPLSVDVNVWSSVGGAPAHQHLVTLSNANLTGGTPSYTLGEPTPRAPHTHTATLTAAPLAAVKDGTGSVSVTSSATNGHTHTFFLDRRPSGQTWYNFYMAVHPNDPNTVYYGEVSLWKTATGDGPWTRLPILHTDNHAFAFAPDDFNQIWMAGDGGIYMSANGGGTIEHRNRDLQILEYIRLQQHPPWETVMIGGTQDHGTHTYSVRPAREFSDGGDGGFTAIDQGTPSRMYHEYVSTSFYRSDSNGALGSWAAKNSGITGGSEF